MESSDNLQQRKMLNERRLRLADRALKDSSLPLKYRHATFDGYHVYDGEQARARRAVEDYAADAPNSSSGLVLYGATGTGKTHLAAAAINHVLARGHSAKYVTLPALMDEFNHASALGSEISRSDVASSYSSYDLLVIDEIGMCSARDIEKALPVVYDVINGRYVNMRPTIICSNSDAEEMKLQLGDRVIERLREGGGKFIPCTWLSYRKGGQHV